MSLLNQKLPLHRIRRARTCLEASQEVLRLVCMQFPNQYERFPKAACMSQETEH